MAATAAKLRVCQRVQGIVFQMEDRATMQHAPALRALAERALAAGTERVHVDLRRCGYLDSTFIGTLLYLNKAAALYGSAEFAVVSPSEACRRLIEKMGLRNYCPMIEDAELPSSSWTELAAEADDPLSFKTCVAHAHQELAAVPGPAAATFSGIAQGMAKELEAERAKRGR